LNGKKQLFTKKNRKAGNTTLNSREEKATKKFPVPCEEEPNGGGVLNVRRGIWVPKKKPLSSASRYRRKKVLGMK